MLDLKQTWQKTPGQNLIYMKLERALREDEFTILSVYLTGYYYHLCVTLSLN